MFRFNISLLKCRTVGGFWESRNAVSNENSIASSLNKMYPRQKINKLKTEYQSKWCKYSKNISQSWQFIFFFFLYPVPELYTQNYLPLCKKIIYTLSSFKTFLFSWNKSPKGETLSRNPACWLLSEPHTPFCDTSKTFHSSAEETCKENCLGSLSVPQKHDSLSQKVISLLYTLICKAVPTQQHTNQLRIRAPE